VVYSVTLFDPDNHDARPRVLRELARETGGHTYRPRQADEVASSFAQIARELRSGYTIGFVPPETSRGGYRYLRVAVNTGDRRQLIARTRVGYYAEPSGRTAE
jgi:VWFA-related protein